MKAMSPSVRLFSRAWAILPIAAIGFLIWINLARIQRIDYVSSLPGRAEPEDTITAASPTGYANGQRELIVPERNENSFEWIAQTQQMFAQRAWRVRHVDYENAPRGREVTSTSPYRWWLGAVAWFDHSASGRPLGLSVEQAARWADPLLHGLLVIGGTAFVAWQFGGAAAMWLALCMAALFPFAAGFLPGVPDARGLATGCALGSILVLLAGMNALRARADPEAAGLATRLAHRWFALAGVVGGVGVWVSASIQVPIIAGIFLGALLAAGIVRKRGVGHPDRIPVTPHWRLWACAGGGAILGSYLIEFFPGHLGSWQLNVVHPLYGLAWIGAGELLTRVVPWIQRGEKPSRRTGDILVMALAAAAIAAPAVAMKLTGSRGFLTAGLSAFRLTSQPHGVAASSFWAWLVRDGISAAVWATILPVLLVLPALWLILRRSTETSVRASLALALGPVAVALAFACDQLSWWHVLDVTLLALAIPALPEYLAVHPRSGRWLWTGLAALLAIPGVMQLWPSRIAKADGKLTSAEAQELIERDLAHWLARHADNKGAIVYAPPNETATLSFYGGLRGLGTFNVDNDEGLRATVTIASVTSLPEAQVLMQARKINYIVIPSWDPFFDDYARLFLVKAQSSRSSILIPELRRLNLPRWLRPVPFQMLGIDGYEEQSVLIFEVVDEQSPAVAMSRLAEYLVETGDLQRAASVEQDLRRFPGDVGALAARAQVESARDDTASFNQSVELMLARLSGGADRYLPWDRRVSLAIDLARADRIDPARTQLHRCLVQMDEKKARSLSTGSLFNLLFLSHALGDPIADPKLQTYVLGLLPPKMRERL